MPDDLDGVKKVQAGYKVQTLSAYLKGPATTAAATIDFPKIDKELVKTNFFEYLDFALQFAPPQENEKEIRAQLARIGVGPGKTFNFKDLSLEDKLEVGLGMKEGEDKVEKYIANAGKAINGWRVSGLPGDSAHYNGDWLMRAAAAKAGIYGNDPVGSDLSVHAHRQRRPDARRQQTKLYADVPVGPATTRERFLVVDHV